MPNPHTLSPISRRPPVVSSTARRARRRRHAGVAAWPGAHAGSVGLRDLNARLPVERDTIFRIASMSKPITCAAALMLLRGRSLRAATSRSRAGRRSSRRCACCARPTSALTDTEPAHRPITFDDLLTHRAGLTYGDFWTGPIADASARALGGDIDTALTPDAWIAALASLPLDRSAGRRLSLRPLHRPARAADRAHRRRAARRGAGAPDLRAARHARHGLHRAGARAAPRGRGVRLRRGRTSRGAARRPGRLVRVRAAGALDVSIGRPGAVVHGRRLSCASRVCSSRAAPWTACVCCGPRRWR